MMSIPAYRTTFQVSRASNYHWQVQEAAGVLIKQGSGLEKAERVKRKEVVSGG